MSAHKLQYELSQHAGKNVVNDPGAAGVIPVNQSGGLAVLESTTTYSTTLADEFPLGFTWTAINAAGGALVIADANQGGAVVTLADGEGAQFMCTKNAAGTKFWKGTIFGDSLT